MQLPLQITFRNLDPIPTVEGKIRERVEELEQVFGRIISCRVVIEAPNPHHHKGHLYHIRVNLKVPGKEIVVKRDPPEHHAHEDIYVAVRECFDAVRRQLEDQVRRQRGEIKAHEAPGHGRIVRLIAEESYGFITAADGEEIYFHRNAVVDDSFDKLAVGDEVRFVVHPSEGEKGPQASTVVPMGKHHPTPDRP